MTDDMPANGARVRDVMTQAVMFVNAGQSQGEVFAILRDRRADRRPALPACSSRCKCCAPHILDMFDAHERAEKAAIQELILLDEGGGGE